MEKIKYINVDKIQKCDIKNDLKKNDLLAEFGTFVAMLREKGITESEIKECESFAFSLSKLIEKLELKFSDSKKDKGNHIPRID